MTESPKSDDQRRRPSPEGNDKEDIARALIENWISIAQETNFSIFRRLAIFAATEWEGFEADRIGNLLVENDCHVLWAYDCKKEIYKFLRMRGADLSSSCLNTVVAGLLRGPYPGHADWQIKENSDAHNRWIRDFRSAAFAKLKIANAVLDGQALAIAEGHLKRNMPVDFGETVSEPTADWVAPPTCDELLLLSGSEILTEIRAYTDTWDIMHKLSDLGRKNADRLIDFIQVMAKNSEQNSQLWYYSLYGLKEIYTKDNQEASCTLTIVDACYKLSAIIENSPSILPVAINGLAEFVLTASGKLELAEEDAARFWFLWDQAQPHSVNAQNRVGSDDAFIIAHNHPAGGLAYAALERLWKRNIDRGNGLPDDIRHRLDLLASQADNAAHYTRIIMASKLFWLYNIDSNWCNYNILPYLNWQDHKAEAVDIWHGYLLSAHIGSELLRAIKTNLIDTILYENYLPESHIRENLHALIGNILVEAPDNLSGEEKRKIFSNMSPEGLADIADVFRRKLERSGEKSNVLWTSIIAVYVKDFWPASAKKNTGRVSVAVAKMLLATREVFPHALKIVEEKRIISHTDDCGRVFHCFNDDGNIDNSYNYLQHHPEDVIKLVSMITPNNLESYRKHELGNLLNLFPQTSKIRGTPEFKRLSDLTIRV